MKTENFDDAINQKLNSINPQYTDADIDKVHKFVKANTHVSLAKTISRSSWTKAAIAILGVSVVALTVWNISQMNKQEELSQTINTLKNNIEQPVTKPDTVYIKENTSSTSTNNIAPNTYKNIPLQNNINNSYNKKYTPINPSTALRVTNNNIEKQDKKSSPIIEIKKENNIAIDNSSKEIEKNIPKNDIENIPQNSDNSIIHRDTSQNSVDTLQPTIRPEKPKSKQYIMAGAGLEKGNQPWGINVLGEYVFHKNISVGLGLKWMLPPDERYHDPHDFHDRDPRRRNFQQEFGNHLPDSNNIKDIHIKSTLLQIPLQISARIPFLKSRNSFLKNSMIVLSGGTDIDIFAKQKIDYRHIGTNNTDEAQKFVTKPPIPYFNNAVVSVGWQYNWKNWVVQGSICSNKQLITVPNKKDDLIIGLRIRAFYTISI